MTTKKLPFYLENTHFSLYANLGERIVSTFLDGLFLCPLTFGLLYFNSVHLYNFFYTFIVMQLILIAYTIYLPVRYGATPGKRVMGLTILKVNGDKITYRESFLKHVPALITGFIAFFIQTLSIVKADQAVFDSLSWMEQIKYIKTFNPEFTWFQFVVIYGYYIATVVLILVNKRKTSVGDQLAGTVVVYTRCLDKIEEYTKR